MLISLILSSFEMQSTYNSITTNGKDLTSKLVVVENLFNYENLKYLISNTVKKFHGIFTIMYAFNIFNWYKYRKKLQV